MCECTGLGLELGLPPCFELCQPHERHRCAHDGVRPPCARACRSLCYIPLLVYIILLHSCATRATRAFPLVLTRSLSLSLSPPSLSLCVCVYVRIDHLDRGGVQVLTRAGAVQFGMPPETVKDSMTLGLTVPTLFVVPRERFNLQNGLSVCELEFPVSATVVRVSVRVRVRVSA